MGGAADLQMAAWCPRTKDDGAMLELSVVICAHNPRPHYLRRVLEALRSQTLPKQQWELHWQLNGRHFLENELGLSAGRQRGIRESSGTVLVFVDDDNVLDANYLSTALSIGKEWPRLGTWGSGATIPEFELQPSEAVKVLLPCLALLDADAPQCGNVPVVESTP